MTPRRRVAVILFTIFAILVYALYVTVRISLFQVPFPFSVRGAVATIVAAAAVWFLYALFKNETGQKKSAVLLIVFMGFATGTAFPFIADITTWNDACRRLQAGLTGWPKQYFEKRKIDIAIAQPPNQDLTPIFEQLFVRHGDRINHIYTNDRLLPGRIERFQVAVADDACVARWNETKNRRHHASSDRDVATLAVFLAGTTRMCMNKDSVSIAEADLMVVAERTNIYGLLTLFSARAIHTKNFTTMYSETAASFISVGYWFPFSLGYPKTCALVDFDKQLVVTPTVGAAIALVIRQVFSQDQE